MFHPYGCMQSGFVRKDGKRQNDHTHKGHKAFPSVPLVCVSYSIAKETIVDMGSNTATEDLWGRLFTAGISDIQRGLVVFSFFFILKALDVRAQEGDGEHSVFAGTGGEAFRWKTIKALARDDGERCRTFLMGEASRWLRGLYPESCLSQADAAFARPMPDKLYALIERFDACCQAFPSLGQAYEAILDWAAREGAFSIIAGQVMTPLSIARCMVELARPLPMERIIDTSCGTANLLVAALAYLRQQVCGADQLAPLLFGVDFDPAMETVAWTRLFLSGIDRPDISNSDALGRRFNRRLTSGQLAKTDLVLGNPPFHGAIDRTDLGESLAWLNTDITELLFIELTMQMLRDGGRALLVLPDGVLRNGVQAAKRLRKKLLDENQLRAVVSLPQGIFLPSANIKSSLIIFTKGGHTSGDVLFYRVSADGYTLDAKRTENPDHNDLYDLCVQYAALHGQERPPWVCEALPADLWEQWKEGVASSMYVVPVVKTCDGTKRVVGFQVEQVQEKRTRLVPAEEIREHSYQLDGDTYSQEDQELCSSRRKRRVSRR